MVQKNSVSSRFILPVLVALLCTAQTNAAGYLDSAKSARDQFLAKSGKLFNFVATPFRPIVEVPGKYLGSKFTARQLQFGKIVFTTLGACIIKNAIAQASGRKDKVLDIADSGISTLNSLQDGSFHSALKNIFTGTLLKDPLTFGGTLCAVGGNLITAGKINNYAKPQGPIASASTDAAACAGQTELSPSCDGSCCRAQ